GGPEGVIVTETGWSAAFARHRLRAIRARTAKPLAMVVLTWPMDEAIFGASVFEEHGATLLAHEAAAHLIAQRCALCLERRTKALRPELMAGTPVPPPDTLFKVTRSLAVAE